MSQMHGGGWDAKNILKAAISAVKVQAHKAAVVGDTVGDPFKTRRALKYVIKVINTVLIIASLALYHLFK